MDDVLKKQFEALGIDQELARKPDARKEYSEKTRNTILAITKELMSTMDGRLFLYYYMQLCRTFSSPFIAGHDDITKIYMGTQAIGLSIFDDIMAVAPQHFSTMLQEEKSRKLMEAAQSIPV